jgi:hypothetical protein
MKILHSYTSDENFTITAKKLIIVNLYIKEADYNYFFKKQMEDHTFSIEEIEKLEENYNFSFHGFSFLFMRFKAFFNRSNQLYSAKLCFKEFNDKSKSWLLRGIIV